MRRYTGEEKEAALERVAQIGVAKTSEEMNIAIQTLYKWRSEQKQEAHVKAASRTLAVPGSADRAELKRLIEDDEMYEERLKGLEQENAQLRQTITKLKKALIELV